MPYHAVKHRHAVPGYGIQIRSTLDEEAGGFQVIWQAGHQRRATKTAVALQVCARIEKTAYAIRPAGERGKDQGGVAVIGCCLNIGLVFEKSDDDLPVPRSQVLRRRRIT